MLAKKLKDGELGGIHQALKAWGDALAMGEPHYCNASSWDFFRSLPAQRRLAWRFLWQDFAMSDFRTDDRGIFLFHGEGGLRPHDCLLCMQEAKSSAKSLGDCSHRYQFTLRLSAAPNLGTGKAAKLFAPGDLFKVPILGRWSPQLAPGSVCYTPTCAYGGPSERTEEGTNGWYWAFYNFHFYLNLAELSQKLYPQGCSLAQTLSWLSPLGLQLYQLRGCALPASELILEQLYPSETGDVRWLLGDATRIPEPQPPLNPIRGSYQDFVRSWVACVRRLLGANEHPGLLDRLADCTDRESFELALAELSSEPVGTSHRAG